MRCGAERCGTGCGRGGAEPAPPGPAAAPTPTARVGAALRPASPLPALPPRHRWGRSLAACPGAWRAPRNAGSGGGCRGVLLSSPHPAATWPGPGEAKALPPAELPRPPGSRRPAARPGWGRPGSACPPAAGPGGAAGLRGSGPRALPAASPRRLRGAAVMRKTTLCNLLFNSEEYI